MGILIAVRVPGIGIAGHIPLITAFVATCGILALGFVDDWRQVRPLTKLIVQTGLALVCWTGGVRVGFVTLPSVGMTHLASPLGLLLTVGWIVGVTNAINLLDGLDGLAAGVVSIVSTTLLLVGLLGEGSNVFLVLTSAAMAASCLGFLFHNSHPARVFMGDTGSLFLGFLLANVAILTSQKSTTTAALGIPILALGVPISDTVIALTRRILKGRSPFVADRHHLHHVLHRLEISRRFAVIVIYSGTGLLCVFALLSIVFDARVLFLGWGTLAVGLLGLYLHVYRSNRDAEEPSALSAKRLIEETDSDSMFPVQTQTALPSVGCGDQPNP